MGSFVVLKELHPIGIGPEAIKKIKQFSQEELVELVDLLPDLLARSILTRNMFS